MAGRGPQTFQKRQKEQQRKEKQQEKVARREQRKQDKENGVISADDDIEYPAEQPDEEPLPPHLQELFKHI